MIAKARRRQAESLFIVKERMNPCCAEKDCDITENPSHFVDIELTSTVKAKLALFDDLMGLAHRVLAVVDRNRLEDLAGRIVRTAQAKGL